jgi:hypothetical protein
MAYISKTSKSVLEENPTNTVLMNSQVYKDGTVWMDSLVISNPLIVRIL